MFQLVRPYSVHDPNKPKFIHSSNIPKKIKCIISNYYTVPHTTNTVQLLEKHQQFHFQISIELNSLFSRNPNVIPSNLIKENLVSLTKSPNNKFFINPKLISPYGVITDEIFLVDLILTVIGFKYDVIEKNIIVEFLKDENYHLLLHGELLSEIETYINTCFIQQLAKQPQQEETHNDSTLDNSENEEQTFDKTINFNSTSYYSDFEKSISSETLNEQIISRQTRENSSCSPQEGSSVAFINNINNLRHNEEETQENITIENTPITSKNILNDLIEVECENESDIDSPKMLRSPIKLIPISEYDVNYDLIHSRSVIGSPHKLELPRITSKPSFSIIQDDPGLEYAFRSTDVPKYIKNDKKFKFIKVGKVQKYVHLFEEQQQQKSECVSTPASRRVSRQPSHLNLNKISNKSL